MDSRDIGRVRDFALQSGARVEIVANARFELISSSFFLPSGRWVELVCAWF